MEELVSPAHHLKAPPQQPLPYGLHPPLTDRSQMLCGAAAGLSQSIVSSPMELVKTRVQLQTEACATTTSLSCAATSSSTVTNCKSYSSPLDCVKKIVTTEGWRGIFRGQFITVCRDVSVLLVFFSLSYSLTISCCLSPLILFKAILFTPTFPLSLSFEILCDVYPH